MMYRILYNKQEIYGPGLDMAIIEPLLEIELNAAGRLEFTIPVTRSTALNEHSDGIWDLIEVFRGEIEVWEEDTCIWFGRPLEITRDWNNNKKVVCEGALAYFNDTVQETHEYKNSKTVLYSDPSIPDYAKCTGFLNKLIENHNDQLDKDDANSKLRHFKVVPVTEDTRSSWVENSKIWRKTDFQTTAECLQSMCLDTNGGYFLLGKEWNEVDQDYVNTISWFKKPPLGTSQDITFGTNLLDVSQDLNGSDLCTVLYPTASNDIYVNYATKYTEENPYTVRRDDGSEGHIIHTAKAERYITHVEGYQKYGRIVKIKNFDINELDSSVDNYHTKNSNRLFEKAAKWLDEQNTEELTIECSAADLHYIKPEEYTKLQVGQTVHVVDDVHGITRDLYIFKMTMNLDSGVKKIVLGTPPKKELTDIIKPSTNSSTRNSAGGGGNSGSGGDGGSGGSVDIPVKDVKVRRPGEGSYSSVVSGKTAKIDLSDLVSDVRLGPNSVKNSDGTFKMMAGENINITKNGEFVYFSSEAGLGPYINVDWLDLEDLIPSVQYYTIKKPGIYLIERGSELDFYKDIDYGTDIEVANKMSIINLKNTNISSLDFLRRVYDKTTDTELVLESQSYTNFGTITIARFFLTQYETISTLNTGIEIQAELLGLDEYNEYVRIPAYEYTRYAGEDPYDHCVKEIYVILIDQSTKSVMDKYRKVRLTVNKTGNKNTCYLNYSMFTIKYPLAILNSYLTYEDKTDIFNRLPVKDVEDDSGSIVDSNGVAKIDQYPKAKVEYITEINEFGEDGTNTEFVIDDPGDYIITIQTFEYQLTSNSLKMYKHVKETNYQRELVAPDCTDIDNVPYYEEGYGYGLVALYKDLPGGSVMSFYNDNPQSNSKIYILITRVWNASVIPTIQRFYVNRCVGQESSANYWLVKTPGVEDGTYGEIAIGMNLAGDNIQKCPFDFTRYGYHHDGERYDISSINDYNKYSVKRHYDPLWEIDRGAHIIADLGVINKNSLVDGDPVLSRYFEATINPKMDPKNQILVTSFIFRIPIDNYVESGGGGGTTIIPNPQTSASEELEKLQIDDTVYSVGTEVIANPTGQASGDLSSIGIGGTKYNIPSGEGGTGNHLDGITAPTALIGHDGDEYFELSGNLPVSHIVSLKFKVTERKGTGNGMIQFSKLGFYDANDNKFSWPSGTTWSDDVGHYENDPINDNEKMLLVSVPGTVTINLPSGSYIDSSVYTRFGWYTANDSTDRDPVGWELYISEDGINYLLIDTRTNQTITDYREVLAFKDTYVSSVLPTIKDIYFKKSGTWLKDDFNSGGGGSSVVANPTGQASSRLIKIGIDGVVYEVSAGAGGDESIEFDYTGDVQTFIAPKTGAYKLEVWGAQGGSGGAGVHGGYGGYSVGTINLNQGDTLYVCVGGKGGGSATSDTSVVGYNGGGEANYGGSRGNGGGATHIAFTTGTLNTLSATPSNVIIVAGGGGGAGSYGAGDEGDGGSGGGYFGGHGLFNGSTTGDSYSYTGSGGTQSAGGATVNYPDTQPDGLFGKGADRYDDSYWGGSGGGGGFYGGGASTNNAGAGGGSGYINTSLLTDACMYGYGVSESAATATKTVSVNSYSSNPEEMKAKSGNGYAKISWTGEFDPYVTVGDLYNACVANNVTPASKTLNAIIAAILGN